MRRDGKAAAGRSAADRDEEAQAPARNVSPRRPSEEEGNDIEIAYGWHPSASVMELHPTIPSLLHASRSVLQYSVDNTIPQLDRNAGYL